ncbi:MAG: hypothetical protein IPK72_05120 [Candidatus Eisenbacteria bacterium]|nr:hypothetical protein [Candidatus Eisenbacteria bacterium]
MAAPVGDLLSMLRRLAAEQVEFIVVGGVGAVLQGAPIATFDLDVVHARNPQNVERLAHVLTALGARYRGQGDRVVAPLAAHLAGPGHHLLITTEGPLDLLGALIGGRDHEALAAHTIDFELEPGLVVRVLALEMIIALKEELGGEKDLAVLPVLRRTLAELRKPRTDL